jgi:hypothetical protein
MIAILQNQIQRLNVHFLDKVFTGYQNIKFRHKNTNVYIFKYLYKKTK